MAEDSTKVSEVAVEVKQVEEPPKKPTTTARKRWKCCTWMLTWYIPPFCLSLCGGMKRKDVQMAWREKVALCIIIFFFCCVVLFIIAGLNWVVCPPQHVLTLGEIGDFKTLQKPQVALNGRFFQVSDIITTHVQRLYISSYAPFTDPDEGVLGSDVSSMFPQRFSDVCALTPAPPVGWAAFASISGRYRFVHNRTGRPYVRSLLPLAKGWVGWKWSDIRAMATTQKVAKFVTVIYDNVYDFTQFPAIQGQDNNGFLGADMISLIQNNMGKDATNSFISIRNSLGATKGRQLLDCINNLFYIGKIDHRSDFGCVFTNVIMLVASIIIVAIIGIKFLAALRFAPARDPEEHDKFVICQIPCYTEGPDSLSRTLESLAAMKYDDKRKLLLVICDGMIVGSGNDRPTPRIALDILGMDPSVDPEALMFHSIGDGNKQLNMGKIYSGLYNTQGHTVPYIVLVKVGKQSETSRPGNRGKRDSQMILMKFLSKVHFNQEMNPLELELYHHMKNVIGVNPSFYEYVLMVDADTEVMPESLNRMVSCMIHDSKIMGLCGETLLLNEKDSFITMIQVYEYFISHHMAKAFESFFGSVTCLPGCFCMYRVRSPVKNVPLLIAPPVITDYSENDVRTLHMKNLLSLGEDRYLTTLMLKHFPDGKMCFTADAQCKTNAPDRWGILLSQRRRWINSTVHNLAELLFLNNMCGCCCFSMRFIVFMDLFGTVVAPATLLYIGYLVYQIGWGDFTFPLISIILIAAIYGFQVIIFILKRQWQHIGWMIVYLLATPIYSFYLPIYSFWHFDDFSWGNTRLVADSKGQGKFMADTEPFDIKSIPLKKWTDYEQEIWEEVSVTTSTYRPPTGQAAYNQSDDAISVYSSASNRQAPQVRNSGYYSQPPQSYAGSMVGSTTYQQPHSVPVNDTASVYSQRSRASSHASRPRSVASNFHGQPQMHQHPQVLQQFGGQQMAHASVNYPYVNQHPMQMQQYGAVPLTRPVSYISVNGSQQTLGGEVAPMVSGPSDAEIQAQIAQILASANLMTITKKQIRDQLSVFFRTDMTYKKDFISVVIDSMLLGKQ